MPISAPPPRMITFCPTNRADPCTGGDAEIGMDRDEGYFVYQQLVGDGQITARIESIAKTNVLAKAGVMIRGGLDRAAPCAFAMIQANERAAFRYRGRAAAVATTLG